MRPRRSPLGLAEHPDAIYAPIPAASGHESETSRRRNNRAADQHPTPPREPMATQIPTITAIKPPSRVSVQDPTLVLSPKLPQLGSTEREGPPSMCVLPRGDVAKTPPRDKRNLARRAIRLHKTQEKRYAKISAWPDKKKIRET